MTGFAVKTVIVLIAIMMLVVLLSRFFRKAKPTAPTSRRQRMPLLFALIAGGLLAIGFTLALASFTSRYTAELLPMRIASVVVFLTGASMMLAFRNWYLETGPDAVHYRTVLGRQKRIAYADIASFRTVEAGGRTRVIVESRAGDRLRVDAGRYNVAALIDAGRRHAA